MLDRLPNKDHRDSRLSIDYAPHVALCSRSARAFSSRGNRRVDSGILVDADRTKAAAPK